MFFFQIWKLIDNYFYKNYGLLKTRVTTGLIVLHLQCIGKDLNCLRILHKIYTEKSFQRLAKAFKDDYFNISVFHYPDTDQGLNKHAIQKIGVLSIFEKKNRKWRKYSFFLRSAQLFQPKSLAEHKTVSMYLRQNVGYDGNFWTGYAQVVLQVDTVELTGSFPMFWTIK